jgi:hypothetical protein
MKIFWENIQRYPRFLITSIIGLVIILSENLLKINNKKKGFKNFFFLFCALLLIFQLIIIIFNEILNL